MDTNVERRNIFYIRSIQVKTDLMWKPSGKISISFATHNTPEVIGSGEI